MRDNTNATDDGDGTQGGNGARGGDRARGGNGTHGDDGAGGGARALTRKQLETLAWESERTLLTSINTSTPECL